MPVAGVAGEELFGGDEAAGVGAVGCVEGVDGVRRRERLADELRLSRGPSGGHSDSVYGSSAPETALLMRNEERVMSNESGLFSGSARGWGCRRGRGVRRPAGEMRWGVQTGFRMDADGGVADGFEAGEAVGDLGFHLGLGCFGGAAKDEVDCGRGTWAERRGCRLRARADRG